MLETSYLSNLTKLNISCLLFELRCPLQHQVLFVPLMLMKLSKFSSRQNANSYWSLYLKGLLKGLLCHIKCVVLQLIFHRKGWSWARKTLQSNSVQFATHYLIPIMKLIRCWQSKKTVSWISGNSCAAKFGSVSGV